MGITLGSDGFGFYVSAGLGKGKLDGEGQRQQDSMLYAGGNINAESGRDTTIAGAHIEGTNVTANAGRNLTVSSVPDTGKVDGKEYDANVTVTIGYGVSVSGSVGFGETNGKTDWVNSQTTVVARDKLDAYAGEHTQIDGAVIASNTGNLKVDTNTLGFRDIAGVDKEHGYYLNAGGSMNFGGSSGGQQDASQVGKGEPGKDSWSVSGYEYNREKEQLVKATVGTGEIIVRSDSGGEANSTVGLNRDISQSYAITKDKSDRTGLYVSSSSIDAVRNPVGTFNSWVDGAESYVDNGKDSLQKFSDLIAGSTVILMTGELKATSRLILAKQQVRSNLNKLSVKDDDKRKENIKSLSAVEFAGMTPEQVEQVSSNLSEIAKEDPKRALKIMAEARSLNSTPGLQSNFLPVVGYGAYYLLLATGVLTVVATNPESQKAIAGLVERVNSQEPDIDKWEGLRHLERHDWFGDNYTLPPHSSEYLGVTTPVHSPSKEDQTSAGGYNAGGSVGSIGNTGGNQLDNQQGTGSYTTPIHNSDIGLVYYEDQVPSGVVSGSHVPHVNGAIAEWRGYQEALGRGELGIKAPSKVTAPGEDYVTYDPRSGFIFVDDSKYRASGYGHPSSVPQSSIARWTPNVIKAVDALPAGQLKTDALNAIKNGRIDGRIFKWPK